MRPQRKSIKKYSLREKLLRALLLVMLLVVSVSFYGWKEIGDIIESAHQQLPHGYSVSYQDHYIDAQGRLTLTEPRLNHSSYGLIASGDQLIFTPNDWKHYFSLRKKILLKTYVDSGDFQVPNLTVHFSDLSKTHRIIEHPMFSEVIAQGCGDKEGFHFKDLVANHIDTASGTFNLDFQYSSLAKNIKVNSAIRLSEFADFEFQFEFNNASANSSREPYLVRAQWALFNAEILKIRDEYCAELNQQDINEFTASHSVAVAEFMNQQGVNLDQNMVARYADFVNDPQSVSMLFQPVTGVPINKLKEVTYSDIVDTLGMTLSLNAQAVQPVIASINQEKVQRIKNPPEPRATNEKRIIVIKSPSLRQLRNLGRKEVKLVTVANNQYRGRFLNVTNRSGKFEIRAKGGYATLVFKPKQIASIEYESVGRKQ